MLDVLFQSRLLASEGVNPLEHVVSRELFRVYSIPFTNHMFMVTLAAVLLLIILPIAGYKSKRTLVPKGFVNLIETVCIFLRDELGKPFLGEYTDRYISFIWTTFFFILTLNLLGMVPLGKILYLITGKGFYLEGAATANIWVVGTLAAVAFFTIHIAGIRQQGLWTYLKNLAPAAPWPILPLLYILEIISTLVKPFALAIRLFANMLAGHVVLATLLLFIFMFRNFAVATASTVGQVLLSFLELFVAFLQAYIFTFLTTIFISFAITPEH